MQGWRITMEDAHTAVLDLKREGSESNTNADKLSFFGVFDGHGGDKVALFAGEKIHNIIAKQDTFGNGDYAQGLKDGFLATDRAILNGMLPHLMASQATHTIYTIEFLPHLVAMKRSKNATETYTDLMAVA